ncbi:hypothetical protein SK128_008007 [Halocaridina rubra]|uniref:C2 domain-containing protein n=1 Tax=Halocaridina rubra TaxID=373956 RepID=A0AAN8ZZI3_HALRR
MGDRTLPPQVEGHPQGRLDLIIGRPAVFPLAKTSQSFIFSFRWWGDTRPCILRLPPGKSESRITYYVTCGPRSFRQYLCDAGSLNVNIKIGGSGDEDMEEEEEKENFGHVTPSPRRLGESPRQSVLRRQLRLKRGWQDGDFVGSFLLPDLKLNSRGDYVNECRIIDSAADVVGTIVVTMIFLEGTLEDFQEIKIQREEESTVQQKMEEIKLRPRQSGIPVRGTAPKSSTDGHRSRSGSLKESPKQKGDRHKSPKRMSCSLDMGVRGKSQEYLSSKKTESNSQVGIVHPEVVRRERKQRDRSTSRERPASWGLYPLVDGTDPQSLVDSGAVRAQDLPALVQVLEGRSPNVDLSNLDPETQKLLDGLDLSLSFSGHSAMSSGISFSRRDGDSYGILKGSHNNLANMSGISTSGVWPLDVNENEACKGKRLGCLEPKEKSQSQEGLKVGSSKKSQQEAITPTKIPTSQERARTPSKACRNAAPQSSTEKPSSASDKMSDSFSGKSEKLFSGKTTNDDEGSVLIIDAGTLILSPSVIPQRHPDKSGKISGVRVMHLSRICYLTTFDVNFPHLELPPDWDISQTCASRQLVENRVHYSAKEVLKLPPASAIEILRGQLIVRCVCRRLGEKNSEEVGSAAVSLMDIWQLNGSEVRVPLYKPDGPKDDDSLSRKHHKKGKKKDEKKHSPVAHINFTVKLALAVKEPTLPSDGGKYVQRLTPSKGMSKGDVKSIPVSGTAYSPRKKSTEGDFFCDKENNGLYGSFSNLNQVGHALREGDSRYLSPVPKLVPGTDCMGSPAFNSIYIPAHTSPRGRAYPNEWQQAINFRQVEVVENVHGPSFDSKVLMSDSHAVSGYGSYLTSMNNDEVSSNEPVESGGESPCIQTIPEFHSDLVSRSVVSRSGSLDFAEGDFCRVHLEIVKGRNLPWVEGMDQDARPPNCYVRTTIGSLNIQTNICVEMDNPLWNFAADVLLPYTQLTETDGSLIFKTHHTPWENHSSPDDPLLGFVCVDATSIWSGHVSLCGWYPLLDLLGCVRGHIKISLTQHEPPRPFVAPRKIQRYPFNLQERPAHRPTYESHPWRQARTQHMSLDRDVLLSPRPYIGQSGLPTTCRVPFHPRYANTIPMSSPRFSRKNLFQEKNGDHEYRLKTAHDDVSTNSLDSSVYSKYNSVISTESLIVDVPALNEVPIAKARSPARDIAPQKLEATNKIDKNLMNKSASSIPVYSPMKDGDKGATYIGDTRNLKSVLPELLCQDDSPPYSPLKKHDSDKSKSAPVGKRRSRDSNKYSLSVSDINLESSFVSHSENESSRRSVSPRDPPGASLSHVHSECHKEKPEETALEQLRASSSMSENFILEQQSRDNQRHTSGSSSSSVDGRPSSCLKVPGSPSLRAKHVTFANKLIQKKGNTDVKTGPYSFQERTNRGLSCLPRLSHLLHSSNQDAPTTNIPRLKENAVISDSTKCKSPGESRYVDGSDLQVVPCREGDTQVVTTTVSVQGSRPLNSLAGSNRGMAVAQSSTDKTRSDLIMSFSWMNQTSDCDTPCVSYIESKHSVHGASAGPTTHGVAPSHKKKEGKGFNEKSRKFRCRLAANFPLK